MTGIIKALQRCPYPNCQNLWIPRLLYGKGKLKVQKELRLLSSWPWDGKIIQDYPGGPSVSQVSLVEKGAGQSFGMIPWNKNLTVVAGFEDGDGERGSQEPRNADGWKRQRNEFSPRASRKERSPANTLIFTQWEPFQTPDL